jgi:hypothetical protein
VETITVIQILVTFLVDALVDALIFAAGRRWQALFVVAMILLATWILFFMGR